MRSVFISMHLLVLVHIFSAVHVGDDGFGFKEVESSKAPFTVEELALSKQEEKVGTEEAVTEKDFNVDDGRGFGVVWGDEDKDGKIDAGDVVTVFSFGTRVGSDGVNGMDRVNTVQQKLASQMPGAVEFHYIDANVLPEKPGAFVEWIPVSHGVYKKIILNKNWQEYYQDAMAKAPVMLFLISGPWTKSEWCLMELKWAKENRAPGIYQNLVAFVDEEAVQNYNDARIDIWEGKPGDRKKPEDFANPLVRLSEALDDLPNKAIVNEGRVTSIDDMVQVVLKAHGKI